MVDKNIKFIVPSDIFMNLEPPILIHDVLLEGNVGKIIETILINISVKHRIVEHIQLGWNCSSQEVTTFTAMFKDLCDVFAWSYENMPGNDSSIVAHEIKTYPDINLVC